MNVKVVVCLQKKHRCDSIGNAFVKGVGGWKKTLIFEIQIELTPNEYYDVRYYYAPGTFFLMGQSILYNKKWIINKPEPNSKGKIPNSQLCKSWWVAEDR